MKQAKQILAFTAILSTILLCSSCQTNKVRTDDNTGSSTPQTAYVERKGITGVILQDCTMTDCFALADMDIGVSSIHQKKVLQDLEDYEIQAGDIVLVLDKQKDRTKVMLPYGDFPSVYGYVSCKNVSTEQDEIQNGNQARVIKCMTYTAPDGNELGEMSAGVEILSHQDDWCQVEPLGTGETPIWVHTEQLSFDFDQSVLDTAE